MTSPRAQRGTRVLRAAHRDMLTDLLRTEGALSRTELAERLGLTRSAVTSIVGDLVAEGIVCELEGDGHPAAGRPVRGRPRVLLGLSPTHTRVAAIQIGARWARIVLADAAGTIQAQRTVDVLGLDPEGVVDRVTEAVRALTARQDGPPLADVGVCIPGAVNADEGRVLRSDVLGWTDVPLAELLGERLGVSVLVQDVTQAATVAEARYGAAVGSRCAIVADYGTRIGIGLAIDGELHRGASGLAGSVGHTTVFGDTTPCRCGRLGCLEASAGLRALVPRDVQERHGPDAESDAFAEVTRRITRGDPELVALADEVLGRGAHLLATVVGLVDPDVLVITGMVADLPDLADRLIGAIHHALPPEQRPRVELRRSSLGLEAWVRGAILVALQRVRPEPS